MMVVSRSNGWKLGAARALAMAATAFVLSTAVHAAGDLSFAGKQVKIVVSFGTGGSYDTYARLLSRYLPRHLAGNPVVIVQNMAGAGGLSAASYLFNVAPKDGTVLGVIAQTIPIDQVLGETGGAVIDTAKFNWIGRLASGVETLITSDKSQVRTIDDAKKKEVVIAATGPSAGASIYPTVLNNLLGTRFKVIRGYNGTREMMLAVERGEASGVGAINVPTLVSEFPEWLRDKKINVITQVSLRRHEQFPEVPTLVELGKTDEDRKVLGLFATAGDIGRAVLAPPGLPPALVAQLRAAFDATLKDPEFIASAKTSQLELSPLAGADLQKLVAGLAGTPKPVIDKALQLKRIDK